MAGLAAAFGSGAMTNSIAELENDADVILITGSNTTQMHPVISSFIKRAVRAGRTKVIVADPRRIDMVELAEIWLRQRGGTDVAWLNGLIHVILAEDLYDHEFVEQRTEGLAELKEAVAPYTPDRVEQISGIPADKLRSAARLYASAKAGSIVYAMGITQHISGTDAVKSLANLAMICGNLGIPGGGVNPLRGQNNVQGACDLGALPNVLPGYQLVTNVEARARFAESWGVTGLPDRPGLTVVEVVHGAVEGSVKALYVMGENPMVSDPDLHHVKKGLRSLDLLVVQDLFLTETAQIADVVLPAACFAEKDGTFTNTERRVQRVRKAVDPPGQARSDGDIICDLATRMGYPMAYDSASDIFDELARLTPQYRGMSYGRLEGEGLQWPCPTSSHPGTKFLHKGVFPRGRGKLHPVEWIPPAEERSRRFPFLLNTGRVLYQYHTGSMTRRSEGPNERYPECRVEMHPADAKRLKIRDGDWVQVTSRRGSLKARAAVGRVTPEGSVFIPFHFAEAAANNLTIAALDPVAKIPSYKVCAVRVAKAQP